MTTIDETVIAAFRDYYPEFSDEPTWPDETLTKHLQTADDETGGSRWGNYSPEPPNIKARGLFAYAAHAAVMEVARKRAVDAGMTPAPGMRVQSKGVGDENVSYATAVPQGMAEDARFGSLSATLYGQEYLRLRIRAGMGAATTGAVGL